MAVQDIQFKESDSQVELVKKLRLLQEEVQRLSRTSRIEIVAGDGIQVQQSGNRFIISAAP